MTSKASPSQWKPRLITRNGVVLMEEQRKRKKPTVLECYAAALIQLGLVDREWAKSQSSKKISQQVEVDHWPILWADGGTNHPTNLTLRVPTGGSESHREKTKRDLKERARVKRYLKKRRVSEPTEADYKKALDVTERMIRKALPTWTWPTQKKAWPKRKMQSRSSFASGARGSKAGGSDTSKAAARAARVRAPGTRERIYTAINESIDGLTADEIIERLKIPHQTASARMSELAKLGRIKDSSRRRLTRYGKAAVVYVVNEGEI
jgi:DNA-binding transcriptional ArsR family regulator